MYSGQCHCGTVEFVLNTAPAQLIDCNCTLCRRLGALWAHAPVDSVSITAPHDALNSYVQGSKTIAVQTCKGCGCTTHYVPFKEDGNIMAVNFRMCEPEVLNDIPIRRFDGADSWKIID